jgi:hypothetical protein
MIAADLAFGAAGAVTGAAEAIGGGASALAEPRLLVADFCFRFRAFIGTGDGKSAAGGGAASAGVATGAGGGGAGCPGGNGWTGAAAALFSLAEEGPCPGGPEPTDESAALGRSKRSAPPNKTMPPDAVATSNNATNERGALAGGKAGVGTTGGGVRLFGASANGTDVRVGPGSVSRRSPGAT